MLLRVIACYLKDTITVDKDPNYRMVEGFDMKGLKTLGAENSAPVYSEDGNFYKVFNFFSDRPSRSS